MRDLRREFGLALQGCGAGIVYLTVFAAVNFDVVPAELGLGGMLVLVAATGILAAGQDASSLAVLSSLGGFLGPVLVTRDASHVALFSYYAVLDAGIVAMAWFRAWRALNLLGFVFTFLVGAWWGAAFYQPLHFATTQPFLALFFALFVAVPVLHAWRRPPRPAGIGDRFAPESAGRSPGRLVCARGAGRAGDWGGPHCDRALEASEAPMTGGGASPSDKASTRLCFARVGESRSGEA